MILHLSRMRRNVNRKVYNDRKNVSATPRRVLWQRAEDCANLNDVDSDAMGGVMGDAVGNV